MLLCHGRPVGRASHQGFDVESRKGFLPLEESSCDVNQFLQGHQRHQSPLICCERLVRPDGFGGLDIESRRGLLAVVVSALRLISHRPEVAQVLLA